MGCGASTQQQEDEERYRRYSTRRRGSNGTHVSNVDSASYADPHQADDMFDDEEVKLQYLAAERLDRRSDGDVCEESATKNNLRKTMKVVKARMNHGINGDVDQYKPENEQTKFAMNDINRLNDYIDDHIQISLRIAIQFPEELNRKASMAAATVDGGAETLQSPSGGKNNNMGFCESFSLRATESMSTQGMSTTTEADYLGATQSTDRRLSNGTHCTANESGHTTSGYCASKHLSTSKGDDAVSIESTRTSKSNTTDKSDVLRRRSTKIAGSHYFLPPMNLTKMLDMDLIRDLHERDSAARNRQVGVGDATGDGVTSATGSFTALRVSSRGDDKSVDSETNQIATTTVSPPSAAIKTASNSQTPTGTPSSTGSHHPIVVPPNADPPPPPPLSILSPPNSDHQPKFETHSPRSVSFLDAGSPSNQSTYMNTAESLLMRKSLACFTVGSPYAPPIQMGFSEPASQEPSEHGHDVDDHPANNIPGAIQDDVAETPLSGANSENGNFGGGLTSNRSTGSQRELSYISSPAFTRHNSTPGSPVGSFRFSSPKTTGGVPTWFGPVVVVKPPVFERQWNMPSLSKESLHLHRIKFEKAVAVVKAKETAARRHSSLLDPNNNDPSPTSPLMRGKGAPVSCNKPNNGGAASHVGKWLTLEWVLRGIPRWAEEESSINQAVALSNTSPRNSVVSPTRPN